MADQTLLCKLHIAGALIVLAGSLGVATAATAAEATLCDGSEIPGASSKSTDSTATKKESSSTELSSQKETKTSALDRISPATETKAGTSR